MIVCVQDTHTSGLHCAVWLSVSVAPYTRTRPTPPLLLPIYIRTRLTPSYHRYIDYFEDKNITVLDFFAGSASTAHAVLKKNSVDGGNRQFILCTNNESNICENKTIPRLRNVIYGYGNHSGIPANDMKLKFETPTEIFVKVYGIAETIRLLDSIMEYIEKDSSKKLRERSLDFFNNRKVCPRIGYSCTNAPVNSRLPVQMVTPIQ